MRASARVAIDAGRRRERGGEMTAELGWSDFLGGDNNRQQVRWHCPMSLQPVVIVTGASKFLHMVYFTSRALIYVLLAEESGSPSPRSFWTSLEPSSLPCLEPSLQSCRI